MEGVESMENSRQKDLDLCRKDFGFFAFQGMLRVFNIRLNLKR
ncbi:hypothetical protein [Wolbachia endosymbiont of Dactylopius coccus]